jgi:hypothetical protein
MYHAYKIVVFDLDETLGYFVEFGMFWDALKSYLKYKNIDYELNQIDFNKILDLFHEFIRPSIIKILNYLKEKKQNSNCEKLIIYTNNQGPRSWAYMIKGYFENKTNYELFDQIIAAFKVGGERVEIDRTSHNKSHKDFIKCTKIHENTQICFLDDTYYPEMSHDNVYYINVKPYIYDLEYTDMAKRLISSKLYQSYIENEDEFIIFIESFMRKFNHTYIKKSEESHDIDIIVSKKILEHLKIFLEDNNVDKKNKLKTKRNYKKNSINNRTSKKR